MGVPSLKLDQRLNAWLLLLLGIACVVLGVAITAKPFHSLSVLVLLVGGAFILIGLNELLSSADARVSATSRVVGAAWIAAGVAALVWPGITIGALALLAGISLIIGGVEKLWASLRGTGDDRLIGVLSGVASLVFGVLALSWPDVTVLVLALLVGPAIILFGFSQIATAIARRPWRETRVEETPAETAGGRKRPYWLRLAGAVAALVVALGLLGVSAWLNDESPRVDAFYDPEGDVPDQPGVLLKSEDFDRAVPDGARGWRILYTTTRNDGTPAVATALVVALESPGGPLPMILWTHGTTGVERNCAPSVAEKPFESGALFTVDEIVGSGWGLVATDYVGLGTEGPHPYLIGEGEARSALDAARAARQVPDLAWGEQTVVWGHSQGGHAALWTGGLAETYAPDVGVMGVAALAPASDLVALMDLLGDGPIAPTMFSYVLQAYAEIYADVELNDYVRPAARTFVREAAGRCLTEPAALVSVAGSLAFDGPILDADPKQGAIGARLEENVPRLPIRVPLLIAQGAADSLVLPEMQAGYVAELCAGGQALVYWTYEGRDHVPLVQPDSPLIPHLVEWTQAVLSGTAPASECETVAR